jgi:hypothetical protein
MMSIRDITIAQLQQLPESFLPETQRLHRLCDAQAPTIE